MTATTQNRPAIIDFLYYTVSIGIFLSIFVYYWTDMGGPTLLALSLIHI